MDLIHCGEEGRLFIVSAPAGTGKTTLMKRLVTEFPNIVASISFTTRAPRPGEREGIDYFFITRDVFEEKINSSDFLEYVILYGTYYGTSRSWVLQQLQSGKHVVLVIDTQGAFEVKEKVSAVSIFIRPPSLNILKERLTARRTERAEEIAERIAWAEKELSRANNYDYQFVNEDLDQAYRILSSIFIAETHRS